MVYSAKQNSHGGYMTGQERLIKCSKSLVNRELQIKPIHEYGHGCVWLEENREDAL